MSYSAINIADTFCVIKPDLGVELISVSPTLYQQLDNQYNQFAGHTLVSSYHFTADWGMWERHPAGDELVILLSGAAEMILFDPAGNTRVALTAPGDTVLVPQNTWHTACISQAATLLFITPGEGTENCDQPSF